jgi:hypothetical protein
LAGPLRDVREVVFCTRSRYDDGHWYANVGYYCDDANRKAYAILPASFDRTKDRLDVFQTDQSYWKSFWYQPAASAAK